MRFPRSCFAVAAFTLWTAFLALPLAGQETADGPEVDPGELPRIPPTEPADALGTIEVRPGFRLELAAHEPQVMDPIAMEFDEKGRLYVVEMRGYSERREDALGRIRLLVDEDGDGKFDTSHIYAEKLKWPTAVVCYDGGIFVAATPDIYYFKDTDGDGKSDTRETIFTGFGAGQLKLNMQALVNGLKWGPDNRIYGATARNGGKVRRPDQPESEALDLKSADFSFDPKSREIRAESGTAQYGLSFDSQGRRFVCSNSNHIQAVMYESSWLTPNPYYSLPPALDSIAVDGPAAEVFRLSPDEPWRIVRTRWRASGMVSGPVEGGGRVSGYFTAATGITLYTGDAFGPDFADNAFIGDAGSNLVHRKVVTPEKEGGLQLKAQRAPDEQDREFLASRDNWFRPVNFAVGPDGCLYIADMYREIIEHPWAFPEGIKKHLDLNSGNDRGRIYRVVPENFQRPQIPDLGAMSNEELQTLGTHANSWHRGTAQLLLWERGVEDAIPEGRRSGDGPEARFRETLALAPRTGADKLSRLNALLKLADGDPWQEAAILQVLNQPDQMAEFFAQMKGEAPDRFLIELAEMIGRTRDAKAVATVIAAVEDPDTTDALRADLVVALGSGARTGGGSLAALDKEGRLRPVFTASHKTAGDVKAKLAARVSAIRQLAYAPADDGDVDAALTKILTDPQAPLDLRLGALAALGQRPSDDFVTPLLAHWGKLPPSVRTAAATSLTGRASRARKLLEAVEAGTLIPAEISTAQQAALRKHRDAAVKKLALAVLPDTARARQEVVEKYLACLDLKPNVENGKQKFMAVCVTCHKSENMGANVGPDRVTFKTAGKPSLLTNILDPNREVAPQYLAYTVTTKAGETMVGLVEGDAGSTVRVRQPGGIVTEVPGSEIEQMTALGQSLMPEGLEAALTPQDLADILEYVITAE